MKCSVDYSMSIYPLWSGSLHQILYTIGSRSPHTKRIGRYGLAPLSSLTCFTPPSREKKLRPTRIRDMSMKCKNVILTLLFGFVLIGLVSCNSSTTQSDKETLVQEPTQEELFSTESGVKNNIENTIWTYTERGEIWRRIEFRNGKAYLSTAFPASGKWGEQEVYNYSIAERRYSDTGKRCIVVEMREPGEEFSFRKLVPATGQCNWSRETFTMDLGDYFWD